LLTGLLVTIVGTSWLQETRYHPSSTDTMYCPAVDPVTTAKVTVNARITSAGFTYPRLQSTVDMVFPMEAPGSSALLSGADTPLYRRIMGCLLGRPYWQRDTDRRPALPTISTDGKHLKIHYESSGDLVPAPKMLATRIGYFSFYHDDGGTWMLDLAYPHALLGSEWTVQITAPPGWLNSPTPPPSGVPDSSRMDWGPLRPAGPAAEAGSANCFDPADCVQVHLAVGTPHKLLAAGSWSQEAWWPACSPGRRGCCCWAGPSGWSGRSSSTAAGRARRSACVACCFRCG
jgi:hypothetical protein